LKEQQWFQSTPPARAATQARVIHHAGEIVSIHAARAGGDDNKRRLRWSG